MTVEEAKNKICPFMNSDVSKYNSWEDVYKCNPEHCMAWQFTETHTYKKIPTSEIQTDADGKRPNEIKRGGLYYYLDEDELYYCSDSIPLKEEATGYCKRLECSTKTYQLTQTRPYTESSLGSLGSKWKVAKRPSTTKRRFVSTKI